MILMRIKLKNVVDPIVWSESKDAVPTHDEHFVHFEEEEGMTHFIPMTSIEKFTVIVT